jgi:RimJ/RimL family protein N-acetyltransferase
MRLRGETTKLTGEKVELRRHDPRNYTLYGSWYADPEVWRLTNWAAPMSRREVVRLFEERSKSRTEDSYAIHPRGQETPIGVISLMNISEANSSADLSIIVGPREERDRGYGTEAISLLLDHAFGELGLHRVGLSVFEFNEPAISAYEKLGFRHEGRLRDALNRDGTFHGAFLMSMLAPEWRGGRP